VLEVTTWVFILIVQIAATASIGAFMLYRKLKCYQEQYEPSMEQGNKEIVRTRIRLQSADQLKDMYFLLSAKYSALLKAQSCFEENIRKLIHRDEQAKLTEYFSALAAEQDRVVNALAAIEKTLFSITIAKDDDEKTSTRKITLVQETSEYIDHGVGKIQGLIHQQNLVVCHLHPFVSKLPDEMDVKEVLLDNIAELRRTEIDMGVTMEMVCVQNQALQDQIGSILGEQELVQWDLRKQINILSKELDAMKAAYQDLNKKYQQNGEKFPDLHTHTRPRQAR